MLLAVRGRAYAAQESRTPPLASACNREGRGPTAQRSRHRAGAFSSQERSDEGQKVWAEYLAPGEAADRKRAKLKAQRLAKQAGDVKAATTCLKAKLPRTSEKPRT